MCNCVGKVLKMIGSITHGVFFFNFIHLKMRLRSWPGRLIRTTDTRIRLIDNKHRDHLGHPLNFKMLRCAKRITKSKNYYHNFEDIMKKLKIN